VPKHSCLSTQSNGAWNDHRSEGDVSALVTLALLNAGEDPGDEKMLLSLKYLVDRMPKRSLTTYSASLRVMALAAADPDGKKYLREVEESVDWLLNNQVRDGGWSYMDRGGAGDSSNTQFAILALHAAVQMGIEVPERTWEKAEKYWFDCYIRGGGFRYRIGAAANPSMSCAGISSWVIIQENLADFGDLVDVVKWSLLTERSKRWPGISVSKVEVTTTCTRLKEPEDFRGNAFSECTIGTAVELAIWSVAKTN